MYQRVLVVLGEGLGNDFSLGVCFLQIVRHVEVPVRFEGVDQRLVCVCV